MERIRKKQQEGRQQEAAESVVVSSNPGWRSATSSQPTNTWIRYIERLNDFERQLFFHEIFFFSFLTTFFFHDNFFFSEPPLVGVAAATTGRCRFFECEEPVTKRVSRNCGSCNRYVAVEYCLRVLLESTA